MERGGNITNKTIREKRQKHYFKSGAYYEGEWIGK